MGVGIYLQAYGVPFVFYNSDLFSMTNIGEVIFGNRFGLWWTLISVSLLAPLHSSSRLQDCKPKFD